MDISHLEGYFVEGVMGLHINILISCTKDCFSVRLLSYVGWEIRAIKDRILWKLCSTSHKRRQLQSFLQFQARGAITVQESCFISLAYRSALSIPPSSTAASLY